MTDPQTPATEAGRRLLAILPGPDQYGNGIAWQQRIEDIEAEARADLQKELDAAYERLADEGYKDGIRLADAVNEVVGHRVAEARADALREAAERVRALRDDDRAATGEPQADAIPPGWHYVQWLRESAVLAILDPQS